jgi:hypothetical protein
LVSTEHNDIVVKKNAALDFLAWRRLSREYHSYLEGYMARAWPTFEEVDDTIAGLATTYPYGRQEA